MEDKTLPNEPEIQAIIGDEKVLYSGTVYKKNRFGFKQERSIVVTNKAVYNLKKRKSNYSS